MKKIMFNDKYGLTKAVLEGRKTMTRRPVRKICKAIQEIRLKDGHCEARYGEVWFPHKGPLYRVGEIVAIAQNYKNARFTPDWVRKNIPRNPNSRIDDPFGTQYPSWTNKMFVAAEYMPHQIKITDIRIERLADISDKDILKEGIFIDEDGDINGNKYAIDVHTKHTNRWWFPNPRLAFATLIDWISGKGTWESNPYVFVYTFELIR